MALVARLQDVSSSSYSLHIDRIATWFEGSFLDLNVTKELCLGGGTGAEGSGSIFRRAIMSEEEVEQVTDFKDLGTTKTNAESIYVKASPMRVWKSAHSQVLRCHQSVHLFTNSSQYGGRH